MKKLVIYQAIVVMLLIMTCQIAVGANATQTASDPSVIEWASANIDLIFGIALAISEFLGATPWLKGNGIIDGIIKVARLLKR